MTRAEIAAVADEVARHPGAYSVGVYDSDGNFCACYGSALISMRGRATFVDFVSEVLERRPGSVVKVVHGEPGGGQYW